MPFVRNLWYVAAWISELEGGMLGRKLLGEHVLIYRRENGELAAIGGLCPHRFAPLELGKVVGDAVECPYHGLQFDHTGACSLNPHADGAIPKAAKVKAYPTVERHACLWIWMGEPALADPEKIPDFSHLTDPKRRTITGKSVVAAHYEMVVDNLLDLSHSMFLHANFHFNKDRLSTPQEVSQEGDTIHSRRLMVNTKGPKSRMRAYADKDMPVDYWVNLRWNAPGVCVLDTGVAPTGTPKEEGAGQNGTHILTPETETSTHYFYGSSRNYLQDDPEEDEAIRHWQAVGFGEQDKPMIEAIQ